MLKKTRIFVQNHTQISVFSIAMLLRMAWLFGFWVFGHDAGAFTFDSKGYWQLAESLAKDNQFGRYFEGIWYDEFFRTPLYPAFLAFFKIMHAPLGLILFAQAFLSALTCVLVLSLASELGFNKKTALFAGLLAAIDLTSILFSNYVLTETVFAFLVTAALLFFTLAVKRREVMPVFWSGALFGLGMLCRPAGSLMPLLLLPFLLFGIESYRKKIKQMFFFLFACLVVVSPWVMRNYTLSKRLLLSTSMQELFLLCPTAHVYGSLHSVSLGKARLALWQEMHDQLGDAGINDPIRRMEVEQEINTRMLKAYPFAFIKDYFLGVGYFAFKPSGAYWSQQVSDLDTNQKNYTDNELKPSGYGLFAKLMTLIQLLQLLLLWALVSIGLFRLWKSQQHYAFLFITCTLFYFACMVPGSSAEGRFRVPAMALISIAAGFALNESIRRSSASETQNKIDEAR